MNEKQLQQMTSKKGFIAALDQSGGSTPKALRLTLQYYMFYTIFNIPSLYYNFFNYLCYF